MFSKFSISGVNALPRFGSSSLDESIIRGLKPISKSIALYIHIPFCKSICHFCMLRRGAKAVKDVPVEYIESLFKDLNFHRDHLEDIVINSIYFGGGTASMLSPLQFELILSAIKSVYTVSDNVEITFEGEPASLNNRDLLSCLKSNGVRRISFGLQTFNSELRNLLGRTDTIDEISELFNKLTAYNFKEVNVDYLYNLPNTNTDFILCELNQLIQFKPSSIDFHPLKYISCSKQMLRNIVEKCFSIPNAVTRLEMFNGIRKWIMSKGFVEQFVDQYSIYKNSETNQYMRNLYGLDGGEYLGIGPGSRSHFGNVGFSKLQSIDNYIASLSQQISPIEKSVSAPLIDNYVTCFPKRNDSLSIETLKLTSDPTYYFGKLRELEEQNYVEVIESGYVLTSLGLSWYQNLQEVLLSPGQRIKHRESIPDRISKFAQFNNYFENIGEFL
ncbi:MAG: hypothetical protein JWP45_665 [Mucilaginibacter sp.]|nr:hypothetical protein [Mucilaginibacter sp.]